MSVRVKEVCRKIICIGRNYAEHAKELGNELPKGNPMIFDKPISSIITQGQKVEIPAGWNELHHEVELGVVIGKEGKNIAAEASMSHVLGYVLALDMTAREIQEQLKQKRHPWLLCKGFDTSCPISDFIPRDQVDVNNVQLKLTVNGAVKQDGNTSDMIFKVPDLIAYISKYFKLEYGDLILTGTPAGVSGVRGGDVMKASLNDKVHMEFPVVQLKD